MRPAVDALSPWFRVLTFSLAAGDVDGAVAQTLEALDAAGVERAVILGVSFGGVVALRFAAAHPDRTAALVLASTPGPEWHLSRRHEWYARHPWLAGPLFLVETPLRLYPEVTTAMPAYGDRVRLALHAFRTLLEAPVSFAGIAGRARAIEREDRTAAAARVAAPTLVVTGEPALDHIVPASGTSAYAERIRGATHVTLARTGHLGCVTRPVEFAAAIRDFLARAETRDRQHAAS